MSEPVTIWSLEDAKKYHVHSPGLAKWLVENLPPSRVVRDFGCGLGYYVKKLNDSSIYCQGYEGTQNIESIALSDNVFGADITEEMFTDPITGPLLCIEVMEHILPADESKALNNITKACDSMLVLSWAISGQAGHGHNNCRSGEYVRARLKEYGFEVDEAQTQSARKAAAGTDPYLQFFNDTLYVFIKNKPLMP